eukprot:TRINITY_DN12649_c0_g1_i1.p1 TRINITY_DN12649_c0_g1~~TRINITY_DN12649_c0_g1_i1.p1  ORF type:complete len:291 (-),score=85.70 TRINITY_DN12649_c0_g1_i1:155-1027(-)
MMLRFSYGAYEAAAAAAAARPQSHHHYQHQLRVTKQTFSSQPAALTVHESTERESSPVMTRTARCDSFQSFSPLSPMECSSPALELESVLEALTSAEPSPVPFSAAAFKPAHVRKSKLMQKLLQRESTLVLSDCIEQARLSTPPSSPSTAISWNQMVLKVLRSALSAGASFCEPGQPNLRRMLRTRAFEPHCIATAMVYTVRLVTLGRVKLQSDAIVSNFAAALVCAFKYLEDCPPGVGYFTLLSDMTSKEFARLEAEFLFRMQFELHVEQQELDAVQPFVAQLDKALEC